MFAEKLRRKLYYRLVSVGGMKWSIFLAGVLILATFATRQTSTADQKVVAETWRREDKLRERLEGWKSIMLDLDVSRVRHTHQDPHRSEGGAQPFRLLDPCLADLVEVEGGQIMALGDLSGRVAAVTFQQGSVCRNTLKVIGVEGTWRGGLVEGAVTVREEDGSVLHAAMHRGVINGMVKKLRCKYQDCDLELEDKDENIEPRVEQYLEYLAIYQDGRVLQAAPSWWFPVGGGALFCTPDHKVKADGSDCLYLYPDLKTGLAGFWRAGSMVQATPAVLTGLHLQLGMLIPEFRLTRPSLFYKEDISNSHTISKQPLVPDIFEEQRVYVAESVLANAGFGLFARRDFVAGDLLSFYNGVRLSDHESRLRKEHRRSTYRIQGWGDTILDIPKVYTNLRNYTATLGHKINHSKKNNAEFSLYKHPRFGEIIGVYATKTIKAGMEVFVNYGYIEKYIATQGVLDGMLNFARVAGGWDDKHEFRIEMKRTIGYVRNKVDEMKPILSAVKMARTFL